MNPKFLRNRGLLAFLIFLAAGYYAWGQSTPSGDKPVPVSLIRVIANPEKFDGRHVRVIGVLGYGGGLDYSMCLYISAADEQNSVMSNCVYLDDEGRTFAHRSDKRLGKYVILNATFHYTAAHNLELLSFSHISDVRLWPQDDKQGSQ